MIEKENLFKKIEKDKVIVMIEIKIKQKEDIGMIVWMIVEMTVEMIDVMIDVMIVEMTGEMIDDNLVDNIIIMIERIIIINIIKM